VFDNYISNKTFPYTPKALLAGGKTWNKTSVGEIEPDKYDAIGDLIRQLESYSQGARLRAQDLDRLLNLRYSDVGRFTILAQPTIARLLINCIHSELASWRQRLKRDFTDSDTADQTWSQLLSGMVDTLLIFTGLEDHTLEVDDVVVEKVCFNLELIDPGRKDEYRKLRKLPMRR